MNHSADIARIAEQESLLAFPSFDETDALAIGLSLHARAKAEHKAVRIDVRFWDRQLFALAMPGTDAANEDWVRRKANVVKRFQCSSYRKALEMKDAGIAFTAEHGTDPLDYAMAGGGFPLRIEGGPVIGAVIVSGLPQRLDHVYAADAIAAHLKRVIPALD